MSAPTSPPAIPLECAGLAPLAAQDIPPRQWAYGHFLLRGSAGVLGAIDGGGKGAIAVTTALAFITGRPLLGERVWRTGSVAVVSYEDDEIEWRRRIAAACRHYDIDYDHAIAGIKFIRRPGGRVTFAAPGDRGVAFPDGDAIVRHLKSMGAALLIVDPFNHAHEMDDGNNNVMVAKVAGEISRVANESGAAVLVLHHLRKGANGNPDDLMGATSLRATFRSCRILARMAPELARDMKIEDPWRYIRIAGSKENYAPPADRGTWFRLASDPLDNGTADYPDGDEVAVATTWQARALFEGMDHATLTAVFAALRQGQWGAVKQSRNVPWVGKALIETGRRSEHEATRIIAAWLDSGVLVKGETYSPASKRTVQTVTLDEAKVAGILTGARDNDGGSE
jgi:hypothetical protein